MGFTLFSLNLHYVRRSLVIAVTRLRQHEILGLKVLTNHHEIEYVCKMGGIMKRNGMRHACVTEDGEGICG